MKDFDTKQKIIIIILSIIVAGGIIYYVYGKDTTTIESNEKKGIILPYEENNTEENEIKEKGETNKEIVIYITGAVKKEGVYGMPEGARIQDAIEEAKGLTEDADIGDLNLAYLLEDGMKIKIATKEEVNSKTTEKNTSYITIESGVADKDADTTSKSKNKVNINTATQEQLETITGVGSSTASKIIEYRKSNGKFKKIEDIKNVSGIGESKYEQMKSEITV